MSEETLAEKLDDDADNKYYARLYEKDQEKLPQNIISAALIIYKKDHIYIDLSLQQR